MNRRPAKTGIQQEQEVSRNRRPAGTGGQQEQRARGTGQQASRNSRLAGTTGKQEQQASGTGSQKEHEARSTSRPVLIEGQQGIGGQEAGTVDEQEQDARMLTAGE